mmetsp:Transcript_21475/g.40932  ORF Transcript_21475/g.40932 Transcript_21475/m.40932 type:complete len:174 (-) Transcript_21475:643-1164(-)
MQGFWRAVYFAIGFGFTWFPTTTQGECQACSSNNEYGGKCGLISVQSSCWETVDTPGGSDSFCCADSEDDCCELNVPLLIGGIVGTLVLFVGGVLGCVFNFAVCPFNEQLRACLGQPPLEAEQTAYRVHVGQPGYVVAPAAQGAHYRNQYAATAAPSTPPPSGVQFGNQPIGK